MQRISPLIALALLAAGCSTGSESPVQVTAPAATATTEPGAGAPETAPTATAPTAPDTTAPMATPAPGAATAREGKIAPEPEVQTPGLPKGAVLIKLKLKEGQKIVYDVQGTVTTPSGKSKISQALTLLISRDTGYGYLVDLAFGKLNASIQYDLTGWDEWKKASDPNGLQGVVRLAGIGMLFGFAGFRYPDGPLKPEVSAWEQRLQQLYDSAVLTNGNEIYNASMGPLTVVSFKRLETRAGRRIATLIFTGNERGEICKGTQKTSFQFAISGKAEVDIATGIPDLVSAESTCSYSFSGPAQSQTFKTTAKRVQ